MRTRLLNICMSFMLSACQVSTHVPQTVDATPDIPPGSYPKIDGSTSTLPLQHTIACRLLEVRCTWQEGDLFTTTWHIVPALDAEANEKAVEAIYQLWHNGTHSAYVNLIHREADFILVARKPSPDEMDEARRYRVDLQVVPVARDAFVFIAHKDNPVRSLTMDQVRAIYTGLATNWSEVGGADHPIHPYQRNRNSGSQELMRELIMQGEAMIDAPDMILDGMMGPIHAILGDPDGIGYSVYYYATRIFPQPELRLLAVDGIQPEFDTLASGEYPLSTEVYAVLRKDLPTSHRARQLLAWLTSPDGQAAVLESGYVTLDAIGS